MTDEHRVAHDARTIRVWRADGAVMNLQFRQHLATAKVKVLNNVIAFNRGGIVSLWLSLGLCESNTALEKQQADQDKRTHGQGSFDGNLRRRLSLEMSCQKPDRKGGQLS